MSTNRFLRLTQYSCDGDDAAYIDASEVTSVTQLGAVTFDSGQEEGRRTRIETRGGGVWLVQETADVVMEMIAGARAFNANARRAGA
jgi:putative copper export protein